MTASTLMIRSIRLAASVPFVLWVLSAEALATADVHSCPTTGSRQTIAVRLTPPEGAQLSTVVIELGYDRAQVAIPGSRDDVSVKERFGGFPTGAISAINDMDEQTRVVVASSTPLPAGETLFTATFDVCAGASPSVATYTCAVSSCVAMSAPVDGCQCSVQRLESAPAAP